MSEVKKYVITLESGQRSVEKWTLRSKSVSVEILSLGCVITAIKTLDRNGQSADIVLGFDDLGSKFTTGFSLLTQLCWITERSLYIFYVYHMIFQILCTRDHLGLSLSNRMHFNVQPPNVKVFFC